MDVNRALNHLNEILTLKFHTHVHYTTKRVKGKSSPWLDESIQSLMDERNKLLLKAHKTKNEDWNFYSNNLIISITRIYVTN